MSINDINVTVKNKKKLLNLSFKCQFSFKEISNVISKFKRLANIRDFVFKNLSY